MDRLFSASEIETAITHHKRIIATMGNPIPDAIKDAVGMFEQLLDTMQENERLRSVEDKLIAWASRSPALRPDINEILGITSKDSVDER